MKQFYILTIIACVSLTQKGYSQTWWAQNSQTLSDLNEIFYPTNNTGWVFGDSLDGLGGFVTGIVLKSTTQGVPWSQQSMGTPVYEIEGSYFFNSSKGIAVGRNKLTGNGAIVMTTDGGSIWTASPPQVERMVDIHFADNNIGWAVGRNDFVVRTNDGGATWMDISASTGDHLNGVFFTTANNGYVVGKVGSIIHSVDSGTTWLAQTSGTLQELSAVYFVSDAIGWAVGFSGTILTTSDSGTTWTSQTSGTLEDLMDVNFVNSTTGWVVGNAGTVLKTIDGGLNWLPEVSGTTNDIFSISMRNATLGWFCGKNGTIHVYAINEPTDVEELLSNVSAKVYPNPAKEYVEIELPEVGNWKIQLYDIRGRVVYTESIRNNKKAVVSKGELMTGLYFVKIILKGGKTIHQKIVFE